jgi:hypothetical protein
VQLINKDAAAWKLVLIEDSNNDSYVAIGEVMASDYTPERVPGGMKAEAQKSRVLLKLVTKPKTVLPFEVRDHGGKVVCRTLGEAFMKKKGVLWLQRDTMLTEPDGCTVSTWE